MLARCIKQASSPHSVHGCGSHSSRAPRASCLPQAAPSPQRGHNLRLVQLHKARPLHHRVGRVAKAGQHGVHEEHAARAQRLRPGSTARLLGPRFVAFLPAEASSAHGLGSRQLCGGGTVPPDPLLSPKPTSSWPLAMRKARSTSCCRRSTSQSEPAPALAAACAAARSVCRASAPATSPGMRSSSCAANRRVRSRGDSRSVESSLLEAPSGVAVAAGAGKAGAGAAAVTPSSSSLSSLSRSPLPASAAPCCSAAAVLPGAAAVTTSEQRASQREGSAAAPAASSVLSVALICEAMPGSAGRGRDSRRMLLRLEQSSGTQTATRSHFGDA